MVIEAVADNGLRLRDAEGSWFEPWEVVHDIEAARIPSEQSTILLLAIGIRNERVILVPEFDLLWNVLIDTIHR
uniref:hypothetical protein n=1 Tax=Novosphingobium naphthalenivorans TaxID=273168 RepID=UPI0012ED4578